MNWLGEDATFRLIDIILHLAPIAHLYVDTIEDPETYQHKSLSVFPTLGFENITVESKADDS